MANVNDVYPSKWLTAADLRGQSHTCTVDFAEVGTVGQGLESKSQILVTFREFDKQLGLNKTNASAIAGLYGDDTDDWVGESIVLFPTRVDFQGKMVDAIRIDERQTRVLMQTKLKAQKAAAARQGQAKQPTPAVGPRRMTQAEIDAEERGDAPDASEDISIPF